MPTTWRLQTRRRNEGSDRVNQLSDSPGLLVAWFVFLALSVLVGLAIGWFAWRNEIPSVTPVIESPDELHERRQVRDLTEQRDRLREQLSSIEQLVGKAESGQGERPKK